MNLAYRHATNLLDHGKQVKEIWLSHASEPQICLQLFQSLCPLPFEALAVFLNILASADVAIIEGVMISQKHLNHLVDECLCTISLPGEHGLHLYAASAVSEMSPGVLDIVHKG